MYDYFEVEETGLEKHQRMMQEASEWKRVRMAELRKWENADPLKRKLLRSSMYILRLLGIWVVVNL